VSKAFTKEDDDAPVAPVRRRGVPVPVPNFVTARGLAEAREELERLGREGGDHDRIAELSAHLATAQVADVGDRGVVALGATVTVEDDAGDRHVYQVVGAIEAEAKSGKISWQSPLATALWGARIGDEVTLPRGSASIVAIAYHARE
jgi:transcription elongation GreA/GreB family factor